jgi:hypothetical protein
MPIKSSWKTSGHAERTRKMRNTYKIFVGKPSKPPGELGVHVGKDVNLGEKGNKSVGWIS